MSLWVLNGYNLDADWIDIHPTTCPAKQSLNLQHGFLNCGARPAGGAWKVNFGMRKK
jgi:hypothetical protein